MSKPEVTTIIVSYNTREITVRAVETLLQYAGDVSMRVVIWDNNSSDGSADALAARFPDLELIRSQENIGFARANNAVGRTVETEFILLLNSDTETHPGAVENLLRFAKAHPEAGIVGGRTVFPDGSLNPTSCWNRMTPWSLFCSAIGLTRLFRHSELINREGMGGWRRDSERHVDIVTGCLFLVRTKLWRELDGFHRRYFMYGEENDFCLRAAKLGYLPMVTPDSQIMHMGGASAAKRETRVLQLMQSKATIIRDHWSKRTVPVGIGLLWLWIAVRRHAARLRALVIPSSRGQAAIWDSVWDKRKQWLKGHPEGTA